MIGGLAVQRWGEPRQTRDVDLTPGAALKQVKLTLVFGKADELATEDRLQAQESTLAEQHIDHELVRFDGGHHLNKYVLKNLAGLGTTGGDQ